MNIIFLALLVVTLAALVGATILGWIAVAQIRRSAGRIYGLGLALFDSLLFPLLAVDGLVWWVWHMTLHLLVDRTVTLPDGSRLGQGISEAVVLVVAILTALVVDFLIIRWAWRAVNKGSARVSPAGFGSLPNQASDKTARQRRAGKWQWAAVLTACVGAVATWAYLHHRSTPVIAQFDCQAFAVDRTTASQLMQQQPVPASPDGGVLRLELSREAFLRLRQHAEQQGCRPLRRQRDIGWWPRVADTWFWTGPGHEIVGAGGFLGVRRTRSGLEARIQYDVTPGTNLVKLLYEGRAPLTNVLAFLVPESRTSGVADVVVIGFQVTCGALMPVTTIQGYGTNLHNIYYAHDGANVCFALDCSGSDGDTMGCSGSASGPWRSNGEIHFRDGRVVPFLLDSSRAAQLNIGAQAYNLHDGILLVLSEDGKVKQLPVFPTLATVRDMAQMVRLVDARARPPAGHEREINFGPVIEREIPLEEAGEAAVALPRIKFFSLAKGQVIKPPFPVKFTSTVWVDRPPDGLSFIEITPQLKQWARTNGVDLVFCFEPKSWHWQTLETRMRDATDRLGPGPAIDTITPAIAAALMAGPRKNWEDVTMNQYQDNAYVRHVATDFSYPETDAGQWPGAAEVFCTRDNVLGVLEIMSRPAGLGVKLRYKLVLPQREEGK